MKIFRYILVFFLSVWSFSALGLGFLTLFWTEASLIKLYIPSLNGFDKASDSVKLEIFAADNTLMFRKDFIFGGHIEEGDNIELACRIIQMMNSVPRTDASAYWWKENFLTLEKLSSPEDAGFIAHYYVERLTADISLKGLKKDILRWYTLQRLQELYTDRQLYSFYLDSVDYSPEIQGIKGGALAYFNKNFNELTPLETAYLLARAVSGPEEDIQNHDKAARTLISDLYREGVFTNSQYRELMEARLDFFEVEYPKIDPFYVEQVLKAARLDPRIPLENENVEIRTHYNPAATAAAHKALEKIYKKDPNLQAAFVMLNAETGGLEVAVGSRVQESMNNRAFLLARQMGSTFKPIVYATALQEGILPTEQIVDKRYTFGSGRSKYSPNNYKNVFLGQIPLRYGLVYSLNNATVFVAEKTGLSKVRKMAVDMGFRENIQPYHAMALGAFPTTPVNVAEIYATLVNYGIHRDITLIESIHTNGDIYEPNVTSQPKRVMDEVTAYQVMYIMQDVVVKGTARGAGLLKGTAAKTGTTDHSKDVWTVALCYPYVIVIWVGYDSNKAMAESASGGNTAAPVIADFQKAYFGNHTTFTIPVPDGVEFATVRSRNGLIAGPGGSGNTYREAFKKGKLPPAESTATKR